MELSNSQIDRAGERIRETVRAGESPRQDDLEVMEQFRQRYVPITFSLHKLLTGVMEQIRTGLQGTLALEMREGHFLDVASRPKTTESIVAKLCRSTTRLTLMQDIAGARIVVPSLGIQDGVLEQLVTSYPEDGGAGVRIKDTRQDGDELGYRAIHLVADLAGMPAEIQIRTAFQQLWAQTVEDIDRQLGSDLKHGVGPRRLQEWLVELGGALRTFDVEERFDEDELPSLPEEILG